jgi:branched-chain amino acid transport system ATP-binding protein
VSVLEVEDLQAGYEAGVPIVRGVTLRVEAGEMLAILGPNGAGKSTLIKAIAGLVPKFGGRVSLFARDITTAKAHELARNGLGFVPQTDNVFTLMSIADNLRLAADILPRTEKSGQIEAMYRLFPDLGRQRSLEAARLSGGQRQMLAMARALIAKPRVLMLDEASAGLSPKLTGLAFTKLREIRQMGVAILLVEQNARAALAACDRGLILSDGVIIHAGTSAELLQDATIGRLVLGASPRGSAA